MPASRGTTSRKSQQASRWDVVVVGGGPAGAVMGWNLAKRGIRTLVLDRATFPREKVCGDFVEPRGLRLFQAMGCLSSIESTDRLAITHVNLFLNGQSAYREHIPFYEGQKELPQHGYIIPREDLDYRVLESASLAGAEVRQGCLVTGVERDENGAQRIRYRDGSGEQTVTATMVVGADGTHSVVARSYGIHNDDPRYMAISQRAYVDGLDITDGEAAFVFDRDLFPGYGWMFPMTSGRANVGVGILAETRDRYRINVPALFNEFLGKLQRMHPGCQNIKLASKPIGGIVKTYGGSGANHFDGGILIGDAGCFVDPMTGEGITPAAESALIGAVVIADALEKGRTDAKFLSQYERNFRAYFDPSMRYLDFVACMMRNKHFCEFWMSIVARGCGLAMRDRTFARVGGAAFGGLDVRPLGIVSQMYARSVGELVGEGSRFATQIITGQRPTMRGVEDMAAWHSGWWSSIAEDPMWHTRWMTELGKKWLALAGTTRLRDPRMRGPALSRR